MELELNNTQLDQLLNTIQARRQALDARLAALRAKEEELKKKSNPQEPESLIYIDVGGVEYHTTWSTLTRFPGSRLEILFSGRHPVRKDAQKNYFIDRDGALFRYVLDFLREEDDEKPSDETEEALLKLEFQYYGLPYDGAEAVPLREEKPKAEPKKVSDRAKDDPSYLLDQRETLIEALEQKYEERVSSVEFERQLVEEMNNWVDQIVSLNVGGVMLKTTRSLLCSVKESMLSAMFAPDSKHKINHDRQGNVFLDRDGSRFRVVLNYMRNWAAGLPNPPITPSLQAALEKLGIVIPENAQVVPVALASAPIAFNPASTKGSVFTFALSDNNRTLTRTGVGHMTVLSKEPLAIGAPVRIMYISACSSTGWLFLGVNSSSSSDTNPNAWQGGPTCYGVAMSVNATTNGIFREGTEVDTSRCAVEPGSIITLTITTDKSVTVSWDKPAAWSRNIELPASKSWYLHVNSYDSSIELL